jgi:hypothetical protein
MAGATNRCIGLSPKGGETRKVARRSSTPSIRRAYERSRCCTSASQGAWGRRARNRRGNAPRAAPHGLAARAVGENLSAPRYKRSRSMSSGSWLRRAWSALFAFARAALLELASIAGGDRSARPGQAAIGELTPDLVVAAGDPLERDNPVVLALARQPGSLEEVKRATDRADITPAVGHFPIRAGVDVTSMGGTSGWASAGSASSEVRRAGASRRCWRRSPASDESTGVTRAGRSSLAPTSATRRRGRSGPTAAAGAGRWPRPPRRRAAGDASRRRA